MAETEFLAAVQSYLQGLTLAPAPSLIDVVEPDSIADLPAIVLSLDSTERAGNGLGLRSALITGGALPWTATIDLANPVLPEDPTFKLLDNSRTVLILPHGGLVRQDGSSGALGPADLSVTVAANVVTVVAINPAGGQVSADPLVGKLTFGTPLPPNGLLVATYFLGQWEQRIVRIRGVLRLDICAAISDDVSALSAAVLSAMLSDGAKDSINQLLSIELTGLGSIGQTEQTVGLRRRTGRFAFTFENEDNHPDSSGGVISRIPLISKTNVGVADPKTGVIAITTVTETN
jgi:hypothetical protein